jgi:hypothetical protein
MIMEKINVEVIKNLDDSTIYLIPIGGIKPLKVIFDNDSDLASDIGTANELLISKRVKIINDLFR